MEKNFLEKINLQLFAEGGNDKGEPTNNETPPTNPEDLNDKKDEGDLTNKIREELRQELIQSYESKVDELVEAKLKEQERLSKLSDEDRREEEYRLRLQEVEKRELELKNLTLKNNTLIDLTSLGLPHSAIDLLIRENDTDSVETKARIGLLKEIVEEGIREALAGKVKENTFNLKDGKTSELTGKDFGNMDYYARIELFEKNPALYEKLEREYLEN